ncbi:MAG: hypothetical protein SVV80_06790 [Planctomycetota bacterium]|nr:hypothetical protein [Planctomycetota bacterium]
MIFQQPVNILLVLLLIGGCSCSPELAKQGENRAQLVSSILSGFERPPSRLFISRGRQGRILEYLGYDKNNYLRDCDHSSDGTSLRLWNYARTSAVVITKEQQARIISTPPGAFLNDRNDVVAWYGESAEDHKITFRSGKVVFAPNFHLDHSGRFFCYGGGYYDYAAKARREIPIRIATVDDPEKPLATSQIPGGLLEGICVTKHTVYIMARTWPEGKVRNDLVCKEYARDGCDLVFRRQFVLRSPARAATVNFLPEDFDSASCSFLLSVSRDLPLALILGPKTWYVYEVKTGRFRKVGVFEGYAGFLDRHIFDRALEESHEQPENHK